jgi:hypothetical protein
MPISHNKMPLPIEDSSWKFAWQNNANLKLRSTLPLGAYAVLCEPRPGSSVLQRLTKGAP